MCTPLSWTFGLFHVQTHKFLVMKISQDCAFAVIWIVAPWNCYQESVVCLASRDLYQASCSRSQSVNASKTLNKRQEDNWSRLSQLLGNANLWEGFTWTMKQRFFNIWVLQTWKGADRRQDQSWMGNERGLRKPLDQLSLWGLENFSTQWYIDKNHWPFHYKC